MTSERTRSAVGSLPSRLPLWVKLIYTAWVIVLIPIYLRVGLVNFLWFCNMSLVVSLVALWMESSLIASMQALAIVWWQLLWSVDFLIQAITGRNTIGIALYMFDPRTTIAQRWLSMFHMWLPILLIWMVWRLGYDRRALKYQTPVAWAVFILSYVCTPDVYGPAGNVNLVYGLSWEEAQTWMPPLLWLAIVTIGWPLLVYWPCDFVFRRFFPAPARQAASESPAGELAARSF